MNNGFGNLSCVLSCVCLYNGARPVYKMWLHLLTSSCCLVLLIVLSLLYLLYTCTYKGGDGHTAY